MYTYEKCHSWITKKYLNVCGYIDVAMTDCVITAGVVISSRRWREVGEQGFRERENEAGKHSPTCHFNTCVSLDLEMRTFDFLLYEGTAHRRCFATGVLQRTLLSPDLIVIKTSQELRMLSSVTINCQVTKIVMNSGFQFSEL